MKKQLFLSSLIFLLNAPSLVAAEKAKPTIPATLYLIICTGEEPLDIAINEQGLLTRVFVEFKNTTRLCDQAHLHKINPDSVSWIFKVQTKTFADRVTRNPRGLYAIQPYEYSNACYVDNREMRMVDFFEEKAKSIPESDREDLSLMLS